MARPCLETPHAYPMPRHNPLPVGAAQRANGHAHIHSPGGPAAALPRPRDAPPAPRPAARGGRRRRPLRRERDPARPSASRRRTGEPPLGARRALTRAHVWSLFYMLHYLVLTLTPAVLTSCPAARCSRGPRGLCIWQPSARGARRRPARRPPHAARGCCCANTPRPGAAAACSRAVEAAADARRRPGSAGRPHRGMTAPRAPQQ